MTVSETFRIFVLLNWIRTLKHCYRMNKKELRTADYLQNNPDFSSWITELEAHLLRKRVSKSPIRIEVGLKFIKIIFDESVWAFVVMYDNTAFKGQIHKRGDLMKPATFSTPAAKARGNIFDGTAKYTEYGPEYLR